MNLTEHFALDELTHSDTAVRLGIDNRPPAQIIDNLRDLATGLEKIRLVLGHPLHINSGYRCEALERILCAKDYAAWCARHGHAIDDISWTEYFKRKTHPQGFAADFTCPTFGAPLRIVRAVRVSGVRFDQLIEEGGANGWVHASFDPRLRNEVLTATFIDGVPSYSKGTT